MTIGSKVLFQPNPPSMAREVGTVTAISGDTVTIAWASATYQRNRLTDFLRAQP